MSTIRVHRCLAALVSAAAFVLQVAPALAGPSGGQGSRVPGVLVFSPDAGKSKDHRAVTITFEKWVTQVVPADPANGVSRRLLMAGLTGGDVEGAFVGEVLNRQASANGRVIALEAMYEVQAGDQSFTALIRGGTGQTKAGEPASVSGAAILDGVVLSGWRTGATVHVTFQTFQGATECGDAPNPAGTCFKGTITVAHAPRD